MRFITPRFISPLPTIPEPLPDNPEDDLKFPCSVCGKKIDNFIVDKNYNYICHECNDGVNGTGRDLIKK